MVLAWELAIITITEWVEKMELKITMIGGSVRNGLGDDGCSLNTIYVRTDKSWKPVDEEGCIPPGQEHRELLVEMSCSCALVPKPSQIWRNLGSKIRHKWTPWEFCILLLPQLTEY